MTLLPHFCNTGACSSRGGQQLQAWHGMEAPHRQLRGERKPSQDPLHALAAGCLPEQSCGCASCRRPRALHSCFRRVQPLQLCRHAINHKISAHVKGLTESPLPHTLLLMLLHHQAMRKYGPELAGSCDLLVRCCCCLAGRRGGTRVCWGLSHSSMCGLAVVSCRCLPGLGALSNPFHA